MTSKLNKQLYLITGSDLMLINTKTTNLITLAAGNNPDAFSLDIIQPHDDKTAQELLKELCVTIQSPSFLGGRKTVCLQGFADFELEGVKSSKTSLSKLFRELVCIINKGIPKDIVLILSGPNIDKRKQLFKACKANGEIVICEKPKVSDRNWEVLMNDLIMKQAAEKGIILPHNVCKFLTGVMGTDTGRIDGELEKIICYCGGIDKKITLNDVKNICQGSGEVIFWTLGNMLGERKISASLEVLDTLMNMGKDPEGSVIGLLIQLSTHFRQLLQLRLLMQKTGSKNGDQLKNKLERMSPEEKQTLVDDGLEVAQFHPYRAMILVKQATCYSGQELIDSMRLFRDAYWHCITSGGSVSKRVIVESLIFNIAGANPAKL